MCRVHLFSLFLAALLFFVVRNTNALVLRDLPHPQERNLLSKGLSLFRRDDDYSSMDLRSTETFIWGGS